MDNLCLSCDEVDGYDRKRDAPVLSDDPANTHCLEVCGDGRNFGQVGCDDGNLINGDGCNSSCIIELGYICAGGTISTPDVCTESVPPELLLKMSTTSS